MISFVHAARLLLSRSVPGESIRPSESVSITDGDGLALGTLTGYRRRNLRPDEIPAHVQACFVLSEDRRFWRHHGIDLVAILRAATVNVRCLSIRQGGSTITQQLVKNLLLEPAPRWRRKIPEAVLAVLLERKLRKPEILTGYLNTVYFGGGSYGIAEAARAHFRKNVTDLTLSEAAALAGLVRAPNFYLSRRGRPFLMRRAQRLLRRFYRSGQPVTHSSPRLPLRSRRPRAAGRRRRLEREGLLGPARADSVTNPRWLFEQPAASFQVAARLRLQHQVHAALAGAGLGASKAAALALRVKDRGVLATAVVPYGMEFAVRGRVQPGSTLKPFVLIAALEAGYRLSDRFLSEEATIVLPDGTQWHVRNYAHRYLGEIDLCSALAWSDNTVFARLIARLSLRHVSEVLRRFGLGLHSVTPAIALGAAKEGVVPLRLLNAYATIAAGGIHRDVRFFVSASDRAGNLRHAPISDSTLATSPAIAREVAFALRQAAIVGPAALPLTNVAAKTGTSGRDHLVCAFREDVAALVWLGRAHGIHEIDKGLSPTRLLAQLAPILFGDVGP